MTYSRMYIQHGKLIEQHERNDCVKCRAKVNEQVIANNSCYQLADVQTIVTGITIWQHYSIKGLS